MELEEWHKRRRRSAELGEQACISLGPEYAPKLVHELDAELGLEWIRSVFSGQNDFTLNWLFLSVSGITGSYITIDDLEAEEEHWEDGKATITALVVQPRMLRTYKGSIEVTREDLPWLRKIVTMTLAGVQRSQDGNLEG